ncbi:MAG: alanine racemase [Opitutae bacterium]|nr:alanine racemase [Opitutae bacterium]
MAYETFTSNLPRAWAEIDLSAFERNIGKIKAALPPHVRYIAVVKADAYGHGVGHIVERLLQCGIDAFAVANAREGSDVRYIAPQSEIFILGPTLPEEFESVAADKLTVAISNADEARALSRLAEAKKTRVPVNVKIDTGMGRMGVWHEEALPLLELLPTLGGLDFRGVFTHFSSADSSREYTELQRSRFLAVVEKIPPKIRERLTIHADNSAGLETFSRKKPFNAVRVGILQYGLPPVAGTIFEEISPEPVLSFRARIGLVKTLPAGTPLSYNRTKVLDKETRIALVTAGYGDGIPTAASNKAEFVVCGKRVPVLGRVTMDQTIIDVSGVPEVRVGVPATIIGKSDGASVSIEEFCSWGGCISWEALVSITKRVPRIYHGLRNL